MKIITVTLNPSLDRSMVVHYLNIGYHNRATETHLHAAGRGMNISEALQALGVDSQAVILLGEGALSSSYEFLVKQRDFPIHIIRCAGAIRSNLFILDTADNKETVIKEDGAEISRRTLVEVANFLRGNLEEGDYVVYAGALPQGADESTYAFLIENTNELGARAVLHCDGESLRNGILGEPELVALTQHQAESYFNFPVRVQEEVIYCANKLVEQGAKQALIMLSDNSGAILATEDEIFMVEYNEDVEGGTHSGTFDALLAGYIVGRMRQRSLGKALELGAAAAAFTAQQVGNEFGSMDDVREYLPDVVVTEIDEEKSES